MASLSPEYISDAFSERGLTVPCIALPPCVTEDEDILQEFLSWYVGDIGIYHIPLTELETAEVLWWHEACMAAEIDFIISQHGALGHAP